MRFIQKSLHQILKFMSEYITLLNLVASFTRPKFSKLLRRASKILKFAKRKDEFIKLDRGLSRNPL